MDIVVNLRTQTGQNTYSGKMFNILGRPIYEYFFAKLSEHYTDKVYLIIAEENDVMAHEIMSKFGTQLRLEPIISSKLTDASLLKRMVMNKKIKDHFIYFSQIGFHDINLQDLIDYHKYNDSYFTPVLMKQPRSFGPYGYLYIDNKKKIKAFNYKWLKDIDYYGYINTGIYALSKRTILEIKNENNGIRLVDDLLKYIVFKKKRHLAYISDKYYNTLGTLEEYYNAHVDLLYDNVHSPIVKINNRKLTYMPKNFIAGDGFVYNPPFMVSDKAIIGKNVTITNSILAGKCKIGHNVIIENAFIGEDVIIEDDSVIKNTYLWRQFIPKNTYLDGNEEDY